jgi:hypothetical protein
MIEAVRLANCKKKPAGHGATGHTEAPWCGDHRQVEPYVPEGDMSDHGALATLNAWFSEIINDIGPHDEQATP